MTGPRSEGSRKRRGWRFGPLHVIAAMLALSGTIRFGAVAWALAAPEEPPGHAGAPADPACTGAADTTALLDVLRTREAKVAAREAEAARLGAAQAVVAQEIEARLAELAGAEARLSRLVDVADNAAEDDVARLTAIYENMKPKDAAPMFEEMAPEFAAGFLARMRPDAAGSVLAALDPRRAYEISLLMTGRHADRPAEENH